VEIIDWSRALVSFTLLYKKTSSELEVFYETCFYK
jgi:hypothetical protein